MTLPVLFRAPCEGDFACVVDNWLQSNRRAPGNAAMVDDVYFRTFKRTIEKRARTSHLLIATMPEDRDQICGWVAFTPHVPHREPCRIHYVYVKKSLRHMGLAQHMLRHVRPEFGSEPTIVTATCMPHRDEFVPASRDGGRRAAEALSEPLQAEAMVDALRWYARDETWRMQLVAPTSEGFRWPPRWAELVQKWHLRYEPYG